MRPDYAGLQQHNIQRHSAVAVTTGIIPKYKMLCLSVRKSMSCMYPHRHYYDLEKGEQILYV